MRHLVAIESERLLPGERTNLLAEEAGCRIDLVRGARERSRTKADRDRFLFVLEGSAAVETGDGRVTAKQEELVFAPAGATLDLMADAEAVWIEFSPVHSIARSGQAVAVTQADPLRFEGAGFVHQKLAGRSTGSEALRINTLRVDPGTGSPDYHIHDFDQFYVILEGEMQIDVGRARIRAGPNTLVHLPAGLVHRNFNAGPGVERHISVLAPEPTEGAIFDYAVEISDREAEFFDVTSMTSLIGQAAQ